MDRHLPPALPAAESGFQHLADDAPVIIWMTDASGYCTFLNRKWFEFTGQTPEEALGSGWLDAVHPDDRNHIDAVFSRARQTRSPFSGEYRLRNADGLYRWGMDMATPRMGPQGELLGYIGVVMDIHERRQAEEALFLSNERFRAAIQAVEGIMWTVDAHGAVLEEQPAWTLMTGQRFEEYRGTGWVDAIHPDDRQPYLDLVTKSLTEGTPLNAEHRLRLLDGQWHLFSVRGLPVRNADGSIREWVGVHTDITEKREYEQRIAHLANHDALTGLPNRLLLDDRLNHLILQRSDLQHGILFTDLDRFKIINDSLGHEIGDLMLQEIAQRLVHIAGEGDTVARFGGDEFVILLENVDSITVARLADRILEAVSHPMRLADTELSISVSIGASMFPKDGNTSSALLKHADLAMFQAKKLNRNAFRFFDQQMNVRTQERLVLENDLRRAIQQNCLTVYYQPQLDVVRGTLVGVEALVRWQHYARGLVSPMEFIPLAEEIGLIEQIGEQVLRKVCEQQKAWQEMGFKVKISVNLSVHQLNETFMQSARRILDEMDTDPATVEFEITESALMENIGACEPALMQIQALGIGLAIDDFGTGYSSLSYLKRLPIDTLKIDRSFVADVTDEADGAAIVSATIGLAQALGLNIVAEGVETEAQKQTLVGKGCGIMQGYLFSKPLTPIQLTRFLAAMPHASEAG